MKARQFESSVPTLAHKPTLGRSVSVHWLILSIKSGREVAEVADGLQNSVTE